MSRITKKNKNKMLKYPRLLKIDFKLSFYFINDFYLFLHVFGPGFFLSCIMMGLLGHFVFVVVIYLVTSKIFLYLHCY